MGWREFRRKSGKKFLYWKIIQNGESYTTESGQLGTDSPQTFSDTPGDKGKKDTKAHINAKDNCSFHISREIRKKQEKGYVEFSDGKLLEEEVASVDFSKHLPKNFCGYKPQTSISESSHKKIHKEGNAFYTRKYDGMAHVVCRHTWGWEIYTRRMDLASDRFPEHIKELNNLSDTFSVGTVFVGEMVCHTESGGDDFKAISRICRSDPDEARGLVKNKECPEPVYRIFDMLYHNGTPLNDKTYGERFAIWDEIDYDNLILTVDSYSTSPDKWEAYVKNNGWEGFVIVDKSSLPGDKFFSFNGEAKRPNGHHKLKPVYEDDVVIYAGVYGTGKRLSKLGSILVKQIHPDTGEWFRCGKCGSGFTDEDLDEVGKLIKDHGLPMIKKEKVNKEDINELDDHGIVTMVEYSDRQPKTQAFRFPVFIRTRTDKLPKECVAQRLAPDE